MLVSIDKSNDFPPEDGAIVAYDGQSASSAVKKSTANDLGADLDLSQLLEPSDQLAADVAGVRPRNAYGQAAGPMREPPQAGERERRRALAHDDPAAQGGGQGGRRHLGRHRPRRAHARKSGAVRGRLRSRASPRSAAAPASIRARSPPKRAAARCSSPGSCCARRCSASWTQPGPQRVPQSVPHLRAARRGHRNRRLNFSQRRRRGAGAAADHRLDAHGIGRRRCATTSANSRRRTPPPSPPCAPPSRNSSAGSNPKELRGALRSRHQARRVRHQEQGEDIGICTPKCSAASRSGRRTASRTVHRSVREGV